VNNPAKQQIGYGGGSSMVSRNANNKMALSSQQIAKISLAASTPK